MKDMLEMINSTSKREIASCLLFFFLGVMGIGLGYRQLLGNIVSFGDVQAKT